MTCVSFAGSSGQPSLCTWPQEVGSKTAKGVRYARLATSSLRDKTCYIRWRLKLEGETENMGVRWGARMMSDDVYLLTLLYSLETKARRGDGKYLRLYEGAEGRVSRGTHGHSLH